MTYKDLAREAWKGRTALAYALWPLGVLYALGWAGYLALFVLGFRKRESFHHPSVCVGNVTVGGTGKTPTCLFLVGLLKSEGKKVVVSASGYGSPHVHGAALAPEGELDPAEWGDEPALFRWRYPDVPLIVGRRRAEASRICAEHFPGHVLLLDDGLQHIPFLPDVSLALDPEPRNPFCLPAGPYREPRAWGRRRADAVLPGDFDVQRSGTTYSSPSGAPRGAPSTANLLCAVGEPSDLVRSVEASGVTLHQTLVYPDHDPLSSATLLDTLELNIPLIVTSKDWVKLKRRADLGERDVFVADYEVTLQPLEAFADWLFEKLNECVE